MIYKKSITLYNKFLIFNYLNQKLISGNHDYPYQMYDY